MVQASTFRAPDAPRARHLVPLPDRRPRDIRASRTTDRSADGGDRATGHLSLARELHDGLLQNLVYLDLELSSLKAASGANPAVDHRLDTLKQVLREGIDELRGALGVLRTTKPLSPPVLLRPRLPGTLQGLLEQRVKALRGNATARIILDMRCKEPVRLPAHAAHHVDSIVQEAVSNALRHGGGREVQVKLRRSTRGFLVAIVDDGCGFSLADTPAGHYGLRIMSERAEAFGGRLRVTSAPGRGTKVSLHIPRGALKPAESLTGWQAA